MQPNIYKIYRFKLNRSQVTALFLFTIIIILTVSALHKHFYNNHQYITWKNAESVTPKPLLKQVLSQKTTRYLDISSIKVIRIPSQGAGNLYIFDYRSSQLCGGAGCLYSVYNESGKPLLEFIANSQLPYGENLIKLSTTVNEGFPCLTITQSTNTDGLLSHIEFCYQRGKYIPLNKSFINKKK